MVVDYHNSLFIPSDITFLTYNGLRTVTCTSDLVLGQIVLARNVIKCQTDIANLDIDDAEFDDKTYSTNKNSKYYNEDFLNKGINRDLKDNRLLPKLKNNPLPDETLETKLSEFKESRLEINNINKFKDKDKFDIDTFTFRYEKDKFFKNEAFIKNRKIYFVDFDINTTYIASLTDISNRKGNFSISNEALVVKFNLSNLSRATFKIKFAYMLSC